MTAGSHENMLLRWTAALLLVVIHVVAAYLLLRGHNLPGGGFIAGLASALSVLLYGLATGLETLEDRLGLDGIRVAAAGLGLALLAGLAGTVCGAPFLRHYQGYAEAPLWGKVYWGTPLLFDAGVMLLVAGITVKIVFLLARSMAGLPPLAPGTRDRYAAPAETAIEERAEAGHGH